MKILNNKFKKIIVFLISAIALIYSYHLISEVEMPIYWSQKSSIFTLDKDIGFKQKSNYEYQETNKESHKIISYRFNDMGLRGKSLGEKNKNYRLVLLGSSVVFGQGVSEKDTMSEQLTELFKLENKNIEVINAGFVAYSLDQKLKILEMGLNDQMQTDEIVFLISSIDFVSLKKSVLTLSLYDYDVMSGNLVAQDISNEFFYRSSTMAQNINNIFEMPQFIGFLHTVANKYKNNLEINKIIPIENKRIIAILNKIKFISETKNIKVKFTILPNKFHIGCDPYRKLTETFAVTDLNLNENLRRNWGQLFLSDGYHLSVLGHNEVAKIIKENVLSGFNR